MKCVTFQEALCQGVVKENDYFLVQYPDGRDVLFRLVKTEKGYVMWGPPTEKKVIFAGKKGYDNLFTLADTQAREEYANTVFKDVCACSLPGRRHKCAMYCYPDDEEFCYALAARYAEDYIGYTYFKMLYVFGGKELDTLLYDSSNYTCSYSFAVRPEAVPSTTMELLTEGQNGSKKKPWICTTSKSGCSVIPCAKVSLEKNEIMNLIREGSKLFAKMKECVKNLN